MVSVTSSLLFSSLFWFSLPNRYGVCVCVCERNGLSLQPTGTNVTFSSLFFFSYIYRPQTPAHYFYSWLRNTSAKTTTWLPLSCLRIILVKWCFISHLSMSKRPIAVCHLVGLCTFLSQTVTPRLSGLVRCFFVYYILQKAATHFQIIADSVFKWFEVSQTPYK